jgi:hypothetical protein
LRAPSGIERVDSIGKAAVDELIVDENGGGEGGGGGGNSQQCGQGKRANEVTVGERRSSGVHDENTGIFMVVGNGRACLL